MSRVSCKDCYYFGMCDDTADGCRNHLDEDVNSDIEMIDEFVYHEGLKQRQQSYMNLTGEQDDD